MPDQAKPGTAPVAPAAPKADAPAPPAASDDPDIPEDGLDNPEGAQLTLRNRIQGQFKSKQAQVGSAAMHDIDHDSPTLELPGVVSEVPTKDPEAPGALDAIKKTREQRRAEKEAAAKKGAPAAESKPGDTPPPADPAPPPPKAEDAATVPPAISADPAAPGEPFVFGGKQFESREKAEQSFKSLTGMFKALVTRAETAEAYAARERQAAQDWMAAAEAAKSGAVPPPSQPPPSQKPSDVPTTGSVGKAADRVGAAAEKAGVDSDVVLKAVDWKLFKQIHDTEGPDVATLWAISGVVNKINQQWEQRFNDYRKPQEEQAAAVQTIKEVRDLFSQAMVAADSTGRHYYPELSDPVAAAEIGRVFVELGKRGITKEYLVSPEGVHMTVLRWRDWRNATNNPWKETAPNPTVGQNPPPNPPPQPPPTGGSPGSTLPADTLDAARQLLASLDAANVSPGSISPSGAGQHRNNGSDGNTGKKGSKILRDMKATTKQTQDWGYSEE